MYEIEANDKFATGRGDGFAIESPVECERYLSAFQEAIGNDAQMKINGTVYRVRGIEVYTAGWPIRVGEKMGILVAEVEDGN